MVAIPATKATVKDVVEAKEPDLVVNFSTWTQAVLVQEVVDFHHQCVLLASCSTFVDDEGSSACVQQAMYTPPILGQHKPSVLNAAQTGLLRHCDAVEAITGAVCGIG